jgi:transcriptional regulator with AAA-type ATPase domain
MRRRCTDTKCVNFSRYGGKGITVCEEWRCNYKAFYDWAMANGYSDDLTIDRITNDGNYEPSNCRWATLKEQQNNRTYNKLLTYNGKTQNIKQWAEELGINYKTLWNRLVTYKWSIEKAFNKRRKNNV